MGCLRKGHAAVSTMIIAVIIIGIAVAASFVGYFVLQNDEDGDNAHSPNILNMTVGDYLKYESVDHTGLLPSNIYWINVTKVTDTKYSILFSMYEKLDNDSWLPALIKNMTINKEDLCSVVSGVTQSSYGIDQGLSIIETEFGQREVEHYYLLDNNVIHDFFIGKNGLMYRSTMADENGTEYSIEINLMECNIDWA